MQHLRFEGEAVASVGVAHPPRTRRWLGAAGSASNLISTFYRTMPSRSPRLGGCGGPASLSIASIISFVRPRTS